MERLNKLFSILVLFLFVNTVMAAEFAYMVDVRGIKPGVAGNGASLALGYNSFGLTGSVEYKQFTDSSYAAAYIGIRTALQLELGVSPHGASIRGGFILPIMHHIDLMRPGSLYLTIGYEKYFNNDNYTGMNAGLQWVIND